IQRFKDSKIQRFKDSKIQRFKDSKIQRLKIIIFDLFNLKYSTTPKMKPKIIGIDLGTTNSCISIVSNKIPKIIKSSTGNKTIPSIVSLPNIFGDNAKKRLLLEPERTIFSIKRLIGRKYDEMKDYLAKLPYKTVPHTNGDVWVKYKDKVYSPVEISGMILKHIKDTAERFLKEKIGKAVITVPAYFNDHQRQATKDAGKLAGLDVVRIINEPTAAALAYGLDKDVEKGNFKSINDESLNNEKRNLKSINKKNGIIAVYDLGGGTFDISILEIKDGVIEVKSTAGDIHLGGDDFDEAFVDYIVDKYKKETGVELKDRIALKEAAERLKKDLSNTDESTFYVPYADGKKHLLYNVSRDEYEKVIEKVLEKTKKPCLQAIKDAKIDLEDIKNVILVGGMTNMPKVRQVVSEIFKKTPIFGVNPDEAVAKGAAIQGAIINGDSDLLLLDVTSLSLGIETVGGYFSKIINRNTTLPTKKSEIFTTSKDNQDEVDISIYQGERPMVKDNIPLGSIKLKNIVKAPKGVPRIEVSFEADNNGIFTVTAIDQATKKKQSLEIAPNSGLTKEEIDKIIKNAEENREKDEDIWKNIDPLYSKK
ncbi:Mitochondrial-type heat shock protein 70, partial [Dictyocoela muelleri]